VTGGDSFRGTIIVGTVLGGQQRDVSCATSVVRRQLCDMGLIVTSAVRRQLCDMGLIVTSAVRRQLCDVRGLL